MPTYREYMKQIEELKVLAKAAQEAETVDARAKIRAIMEENGLTTADISEPKRSAKPGAKKLIPALYKDSETGATWSGRGRAPTWIAGQDRTKFLIESA